MVDTKKNDRIKQNKTTKKNIKFGVPKTTDWFSKHFFQPCREYSMLNSIIRLKKRFPYISIWRDITDCLSQTWYHLHDFRSFRVLRKYCPIRWSVHTISGPNCPTNNENAFFSNLIRRKRSKRKKIIIFFSCLFIWWNSTIPNGRILLNLVFFMKRLDLRFNS